MIPLSAHFHRKLARRKQDGNWRRLKVPSSHLIDFASNDYLGFLHHGLLDPFVKDELEQLGEEKYRWHGASGSRLLTGNSAYCENLETEIAQFHEAETGLIFNSGYLANVSLGSTIIGQEDQVLYDQHIHASWHDAFKLARVRALPFKQDLTTSLKNLRTSKGRLFVCVQSVSSCDGAQINLKGIQQICEKYGAYLIVDEAHATGWLGKNGEGGVQAYGLQTKVFARVHTFGKALGCQGAIILGDSILKEYLINFARPFIYTTALPLYSLAVIRAAYRTMKNYPQYQTQLKAMIHHFKRAETSLPIVHSHSPIQCLKIRGNQAAMHLANLLKTQGFDVRPLLSPTVRRGEECLRICLHAFNTQDEIDRLLEILRQSI